MTRLTAISVVLVLSTLAAAADSAPRRLTPIAVGLRGTGAYGDCYVSAGGGGVNQMESRGISAWPAKNCRSDPNNWTLTEVAIYYNAPLVFLSGYFAQ